MPNKITTLVTNNSSGDNNCNTSSSRCCRSCCEEDDQQHQTIVMSRKTTNSKENTRRQEKAVNDYSFIPMHDQQKAFTTTTKEQELKEQVLWRGPPMTADHDDDKTGDKNKNKEVEQDADDDNEEEEQSSIISSSCSSYDSYDEDDSRQPSSYLSPSIDAHEYNHSIVGSFAVSVSPIDFIDEQGNLPLTKVSSILPAVAEEQNEDDEDYDDADLLQVVGTSSKIYHETIKGDEDDTLSTVESITECTISIETPRNSTNTSIQQYESTKTEQELPNVINSIDSSKDDQIRAMLIMKDVIFRQRSVIKNITKARETLQKKYDLCKLQNNSLSRANKHIAKEMKSTCKKNDALKQELEKLGMELQLAKVEILRLKNDAG